MSKKSPELPAKSSATRVDWTQYMVNDPEAFARNMVRLVEEGGKAWAALIERSEKTGGAFSQPGDVNEATHIVGEIMRQWFSDPVRAAESQGELIRGYFDVWDTTVRRMMGEDVEDVAKPEPGDSRFRDEEWTANPYFDFWKQAYLVTSNWAEKIIDDTEGFDERTRQRAEYYFRQVASALSPTNFPLTNPEVLRETFKSNGENLVRGVANLIHDLEAPGELMKISQTDTKAFEVGRNLAVTPGKVVFQNDIFQLIQYTPSTAKVREVPLLIVPPWINKFYILDLTEQKSLIRYIVSQGFTVFVVSWVNPDARLANKTFEDYMREGIHAATDAVQRETGVEKINIVGYCVGGTLLATTLAYDAATGRDNYVSATFFAAQADFTKAGDLLLFIDDAQLKALEEMMAERGYLDGSRMATVFNLLRPRDLIWPYIVNNYMLGKTPFPFDLLYWNQDSTRMPPANHSFYLRQFYKDNKLAKGELKIGGIKLDMSKVKLPVYELAAREDHIAPAKSVFISSRLFGGPVDYVMSGSGHIAGVINPPIEGRPPKYQFWTNPDRVDDIEEWLEGAKETPGSWWPHWMSWLKKRSGGMVPAREPGATLGVIEDAPGSYVRAKT
ncbi:MAG TPA: class I poly(R)-hydroxyalkanoic acid synthase [Hyphomicrobiaceae bacterium]|nr:class I poly(R)-hydroxyalkanoic acid synthase [Hyphomicrobiaceae bacterium]